MLTFTAATCPPSSQADVADFAATHVYRVALNLGVPSHVAQVAAHAARRMAGTPFGTAEDAICVGTSIISDWLRAHSVEPHAPRPFAWVESWWFGACAVMVVSALLLARIAGWLP